MGTQYRVIPPADFTHNGVRLTDDEVESDMEMAVEMDAFEYAAACQRELNKREIHSFITRVFEVLSQKDELDNSEVGIHSRAIALIKKYKIQ